jgi:hypothetical protein
MDERNSFFSRFLAFLFPSLIIDIRRRRRCLLLVLGNREIFLYRQLPSLFFSSSVSSRENNFALICRARLSLSSPREGNMKIYSIIRQASQSGSYWNSDLSLGLLPCSPRFRLADETRLMIFLAASF